MANHTNGKPVAEIRVGRITATIWQNTPTDDGVFYSVHITRLFRRGSTWDRTPAFGRDDLLTQAVSVGARLADALAALREKKCLHGAVKPSIRPSLRVIGVRLQDVAGRGSRDRQPHRAVQLHAVDLEEQLRTCSGVSVGASSSMSHRTPTGQDGTTYTEFYVAGVPQ